MPQLYQLLLGQFTCTADHFPGHRVVRSAPEWVFDMGPGNGRMYSPSSLFRGSYALVDALDLLPLPSLVLADDGSALAVNRAWTLLSGVPAEDSRGEGWLGALELLDRGPLRRLLVGAAAAAEPGSADFRLTGQGSDQRCRWWWQPGAPGQLVVCVAGLDQPARGNREAVTPLDATADVVNRLFHVGLTLTSTAGMVNGLAKARLHEAIDELDRLISDVRSAVSAPMLEAERRGRPGRSG